MKPETATRPPRTLTVTARAADDEEEIATRPLSWGLIRRLFTYTRQHAGKRNALIVLTLLRSAQLPALVWWVGLVIGGPVARGEADALVWWLGGYLVLAILTDGLFHFRQRLALELGEAVVHALRQEIFDRVQRQPMSFFHRVKLGRIIGRLTSDAEALRTAIQDVFFVSVVQVGQMLFSAVVMAFCDWVMFLVVVAIAPVLYAINQHFRGRLSRYSRAAQESFSRITATLAESVNGIRVTQGFVRQETNAGLFRSLLADHSRYNIALARTSALLQPLLELNSQFFIAVLLLLGGWRTFHGSMEVAALIQFFFLANQFFSPLQVLGNQYNQALVAMAGAERVFRLIDTPPDWQDATDAADLPDPREGKFEVGSAKSEVQTTAASLRPSQSSLPPAAAPSDFPIPASAGMSVEFRSVGFAYVPDRPVLHDVSFTAAPGQTIALVGHTGSGKSSIINLVSKFYLPTSGTILVDGRDLARVTSRSLHRQMGAVWQQNFLFSGTVLNNIRFARPTATDADVRAACAHLDCLDLLETLPQGLHTTVGEKGAGLSLGQRQLVCFARALLADPRLIILDEATSAIDALTEARLQRALAALLRGRTAFVVAHRLSTIRHADLVLVLDQGRVMERGTHQQLVYQDGHYARLWRQFVQVDDTA